MSGFLARLVVVAMLAWGSVAVQAFSLLGPFKTWQVLALGYNLPGDGGGPMTLSEGYRWNVPTIVYAFDQSFIAYFGLEGMAAVERAVGILNDLPKASEITDDGSRLYIRGQRVAYDTKRVNFQAQALGLLDLKSVSLILLVEQLGLAEAERYVWTLRGRNTETIAGTTYTNYTVIKLNYDPITLQPSSFVNGVAYTYEIFDPIQPGNYAEAIESVVDPLAFPFSSVAGGGVNFFTGDYFTGLTHDDVGAIRFLLNPINFAGETMVTGVDRGTGGGRVSPWIPFNTLSNILSGNTNITVPVPQPGGTNAQGTNITRYVDLALRPGLEKLTFKRGNFDSLIGQLFITVTNQWNDRYVSNGVPRTQPLQRVVDQPDILFTCEDMGLVDNLVPVLTGRTTTTGWLNNDLVNGVAGHGGPGVITPPITVSFTDQLPFFGNTSPFLNEGGTFFGSGVWGSFDGTTNPPVIFPKYLGLTLDDLRRLSSGRN